jgi:hypothetical protein
LSSPHRVQEFAGGGDLFEDLKKNGGQLKEKHAVRDVIAPFLNALDYMHGMVSLGHTRVVTFKIILTTANQVCSTLP